MRRIVKEYIKKPEHQRNMAFTIGQSDKDFIRAAIQSARMGFSLGQNDDPIDVVKFAMRKVTIKSNCGKTFLPTDSESSDRYRVLEYYLFTGKFAYDRDVGAFVPAFKSCEISDWLANYYEARELDEIHAAWNEISQNLVSPNGRPAVLVTNLKSQHVYILRNLDNEELKIGISMHPAIRAKQVGIEVRASLEILAIIPDGGRDLERELHQKFDEHRLHGEWFAPEAEIYDYLHHTNKAA